MQQKIQAFLALIPHWLFLLAMTFGGGIAVYLKTQPVSTLFADLQNSAGIWNLAQCCLMAGAAAVVAWLKVPSTPSATPRVPPLAVLAIRSLAAFAMVLLFAVGLSACLSGVPIVPVTPQNSAQVSSCQSTESLHNGLVVGDFVLGGATTGLASVSAAVADTGTKNVLGVTAAIVGAVAVVDTAVTALTTQSFANGNCSALVGALPSTPTPDAGAN